MILSTAGAGHAQEVTEPCGRKGLWVREEAVWGSTAISEGGF